MNNYSQIDFTKLKPGNYNRKSSESEDKQMLSIGSQKDEAKRISDFYKLPKFIEVFEESKSAKKEFLRPEYMKMVDMIKKGTIDSIVCWKLDRLARNMTEGGMLIDLISSGVIKAIITHDKVYYPSDNVLLMSVEFGQGKQFVKDLSVNVKRGQDKKARMGIPHGVASLGFLNDKTEERGNRNWMVDEIRLGKIKILLDMFLTGTYSAGKLYKHAVEELRLTTVERKRSGGNLITSSRIYEILKDPVYAGFFFLGGERYWLSNKLPRLITEDQHNKIKMILSGKNIPKIQEHKTVYSGFINSSEGNFMGQDVKYQLICDCKCKFAYRNKTHCPKCHKEIAGLENPKYLGYIHYYDVKKKKAGIKAKSIEESIIDKYITKFANENLIFSKEFADWSKKYITELKNQEISNKVLLERSKEERRIELENKKSRLREMFRDEQITEVEYKEDLSSLNEKYKDVGENSKSIDWYSEMNEIVDITQELGFVLKNGTIQAKRNILSKLGSNLTWNGEILNISNKKSINKLVERIISMRLEFPRFEPKTFFTAQGLNEKTDGFSPVFSTMLRG